MRLPPPPVLALAAGLAQRLLTRDVQRPTAVRALAAGVTAAASMGLAGAGARQFRRRGTTLDPQDPAAATVLVTTGPNAVSRNPMYVGLAGLLVSYALWRGSWTAAVPVVGFALVMDRVQIPSEEAALGTRFGAEYDAYRAAVPRWLDARSAGA